MKRQLIAVVALLGISLLILHQVGRLKELTNQLVRLRREVARENLQRWPAPAAVETGQTALSAKAKRLELLLRKARKGPAGIPLPNPEDLFGDYPELETTFLKSIEGHLRLKFASFFLLAGLSPQQIERYIEISMAGERDSLALTKEAATRGVTLADPAIKDLGRVSFNQRKREMAELLGPANLALRERSSDERPARNMLAEVAKATALGNHPLSFDQLNQLAAMTTELGVFENERTARDSTVFALATKKAAEILEPEQRLVFDLLIDASQARLVRALDRRKSH